jgi:hypothetical protein
MLLTPIRVESSSKPKIRNECQRLCPISTDSVLALECAGGFAYNLK